MDTSCAGLDEAGAGGPRPGYKVALTGEGADEALAGYVWFKTQAIRDRISQRDRHRPAVAGPQAPARGGRRRLGASARRARRSAGSGPPSRTCTS